MNPANRSHQWSTYLKIPVGLALWAENTPATTDRSGEFQDRMRLSLDPTLGRLQNSKSRHGQRVAITRCQSALSCQDRPSWQRQTASSWPRFDETRRSTRVCPPSCISSIVFSSAAFSLPCRLAARLSAPGLAIHLPGRRPIIPCPAAAHFFLFLFVFVLFFHSFSHFLA